MSHRLSSRRRASAVVVLLLTLVVAILPPASAAQAKVRKLGPAVTITSTNAAFSPNGDGSKDRGSVGYRLASRAYVSVAIFGAGRSVLTRKLGRQSKGAHTWTWDGTRAGRVVADGTYTIKITSRRTRHGKPRAVQTKLVVDARTTPGHGTARLSSGTVYPRTTVIHDVVIGNFFPARGTSILRPDLYYPTVRYQVLAATGRVIDSGGVDYSGTDTDLPSQSLTCYAGCGRFEWDGRTSGGSLALGGTYRIRVVRGVDAAGNPRVLAPSVSVRVSPGTLVAKTTSVSLAADSSSLTRALPYVAGCTGCSGVVRSATPSSRFVGGLTFLATCPDGRADETLCSSSEDFLLPFAGRRTPWDRFTLVAHGGPTTAGANDKALLTDRSDLEPSAYDEMQGDTTGTLTGSFFAPNTEVPLPGRLSGLRWTVATWSGRSYDVASFDVSYTTYVPAS